MDEQATNEKILSGRNFMRARWSDEEIISDQMKQLPQPPLVKAPMGGERMSLPRDFKRLPFTQDILQVLTARKSSRVYTHEPVALLAFSFLLWAQQGIKSVRGKSYATLRTVACGGARHEFELYIAVMNVEGLKPGLYHYLPMTHELELLGEAEAAQLGAMAGSALADQPWCARGAAVFFYSVVPYRAEWRYSSNAHRVALIDAGHITQNLYVACSALNKVGTCAIAALDGEACDAMFGLDGQEEFIFYAAALGSISPNDQEKEDLFYAFLKDEEED
ncbi:MAG: SagB/ThcOx family dehydrogenase [Clostridiales bacterium]|nr:SagB/ThcOx family dehydrogenase [Clostridiales bacterium]